MEIKGSGSKGVADLTALRRYTPSRATGEGPKADSAATTPGAKVELSAKAKELESIRSLLDQIPDVDEAKVADLRARIQNGTYQPDLEKTADGLLQEACWAVRDQT